MDTPTISIKRAEWRETVQHCLDEIDAILPSPNWDYIIFGDESQIDSFKPLPLKNIKLSATLFMEMPPEEKGRIVILPRSYKVTVTDYDENENPIGLKKIDKPVSFLVYHAKRNPFDAPQFRLATPSYAYLIKIVEDENNE